MDGLVFLPSIFQVLLLLVSGRVTVVVGEQKAPSPCNRGTGGGHPCDSWGKLYCFQFSPWNLRYIPINGHIWKEIHLPNPSFVGIYVTMFVFKGVTILLWFLSCLEIQGLNNLAFQGSSSVMLNLSSSTVPDFFLHGKKSTAETPGPGSKHVSPCEKLTWHWKISTVICKNIHFQTVDFPLPCYFSWGKRPQNHRFNSSEGLGCWGSPSLST